MIHAKYPQLEDLVLQELQFGSVPAVELIETIMQKRPGTTKQGVYAALRKLKKKEVVVTNKKMVMLNVSWLKKLEHFVSIAEHYYVQTPAGAGYFAQLQPGEKISYTFQNSIQADVFWNHALVILTEVSKNDDPFVSYCPHVWFYHVHEENEIALRDFFAAQGKQYLVVAGSRTPLDKAVRTYFDGLHAQYHTLQEPLFPQNYYLNILGEYIVEFRIDTEVAAAIHHWYQKHLELTPQAKEELQHVLEQRGQSKLVISRKPDRALRLQKKLIRYFYKEKKVHSTKQ